MKNIQNFDEFVKESSINEGLAAKAFSMYDTVDMLMDDFDDKETKEIHERACELLGEDPSNVCRLDSETDYDDPILEKAYKTINNKYRGSFIDHNLDLGNGEDMTMDKMMHVVRYDDYGFVAYFFTSRSNF
jgi:hypothetical protein